MQKHVLLIGTGRMAREYVRVLLALNTKPVVVGRSSAGVQTFVDETGIAAHSGGLRTFQKSRQPIPSHAIIAVDPDQLARVACETIAIGCKHILLEKPGGLSLTELLSIKHIAKKNGTRVWIAYNRRYLASVLEAQKYIARDGGVMSFTFTFTEKQSAKQIIKQFGISRAVERNWFIANSTHVVDLAFYLGGIPKDLVGIAATGPLWTPHPSLFAGSGITQKNIPFSYSANWELPGPWAVSVGTKKRNLILQPLESLTIEANGLVEKIVLDDELDKKYKPGLYLQTKVFLNGAANLLSLEQQIAQFEWFNKIICTIDKNKKNH